MKMKHEKESSIYKDAKWSFYGQCSDHYIKSRVYNTIPNGESNLVKGITKDFIKEK